jgi:DNA repair exonuclease SbcCD ATPase subunit
MSLFFEYVRWKNLLSTGNAFTEIRLDKSPSTLIVGKNGEGKSTLGDAICLALYNKPFRKIKKPQLVNSINGGGLEVEIAFRGHDQKRYVVRRGIKPDLFEIQRDGVILDQEAASKDAQVYLEQHILRLNFKSFTQIVFLGSAGFVPFMQLPTAARRDIIDDLLDIRVFSTMAALLKDRLNEVKSLKSTETSVLSHKRHLLAVYHDQEIQQKERSTAALEECDRRIVAQQALRDELTAQLVCDTAAVTAFDRELSGEAKLSQHIQALIQLEKDLQKKLTKLQTSITFFENTDSCPTCTQSIPEAFCDEQIISKELVQHQVNQGLQQLRDELAECRRRADGYASLHAKRLIAKQAMDDVIAAIRDTKKAEEMLSTQREDLLKPVSEDLTDQIAATSTAILSSESTLQNLTASHEVMEVASVILRDDGIKSRIVAQYIPVVNQLVNKYLAALDFFVSFELNENFEEVIRSRYRDDFSYHSFSEGEKMRIDLAILFTWRAVAKLKNSASTNILILDEVFDASLDASGCDDFLKLIHTLDDCSVFVISHKGDVILDKFRDVIRFEKQQNFSRIVTAT